MNNKAKIVAVIPAKADSTRLPNKNMALMAGKPLLHFAIKAAQQCRLIEQVYVSTDSSEIAEFTQQEDADVIMRPANLAGEAPLVEVYRHTIFYLKDEGLAYIVGLQPDHPDRRIDLDNVIRYAMEKDLDDLISVDSAGKKNGSLRIMKAEALKNNRISINLGSIMDNATNIHTLKDLQLAQIRLGQKALPLSIRIKNKVISRQAPAFIIAEGACNHMCNMRLAREMIDEAARAGADAIKFQTYKAERLVAKDARSYWNYGPAKSQYEYYKNLDKFDRQEYQALFDYAQDKEIVVFSSPFDIESADMLNELDMPLFKIASCLIPDTRLIRHIAKFKKPIILSTGGSELDEIKAAVQTIYGADNYSLVLLACTLSYPAKNEDAELKRIGKLDSLFPEAIVGYSDHTEPDENMIIPALAVSQGAKVIEKHFTLDRKMTGSGHSFSVDPVLLAKMIRNIRLAEQVNGRERFELKEAEKQTRAGARMNIVVKQEIKSGQGIAEDMLTAKRAPGGISPSFIDEIVGRQARRNLRPDEQLQWSDIS